MKTSRHRLHFHVIAGLPRTTRLVAYLLLIGLASSTSPWSMSMAQSALVTAVNSGDPFAAQVAEASQRFGIPKAWIRAVMRAESAGDVQAVSSDGAMGLMQIMPRTWAELRVRHRLGSDPYEPRDNILAGTAYLRELYDCYGSPGFLAAYNAGPGRYMEHLATGRALPAETQSYVAALAPLLGGKQADGAVVAVADPQTWTRAPLFIAPAESTQAADRSSPGVQPEHGLTSHSVVDLSAIAPQADGLFVRRGVSEIPQ